LLAKAVVALAHLLIVIVALGVFVRGLALLDANLGFAFAAGFVLVVRLAFVAVGLVAAFALVAFVRVAVGLGIALDQIEVLQHLRRKLGEGGLIVEDEAERVEIGAGFLLDPRGDEI